MLRGILDRFPTLDLTVAPDEVEWSDTPSCVPRPHAAHLVSRKLRN